MSASSPVPSVFDVNALTTLKAQVKRDDPEALRAAAKQFEGLFLQMVLKSMRDSVPREGLFDNDQSRMYESLLDQQGRRWLVVMLVNHPQAGAAREPMDALVEWVAAGAAGSQASSSKE